MLLATMTHVFDGSPTQDDVVEPYKLAVDQKAQAAYLLGCSVTQRIPINEKLTGLRMDRIDLRLNERTHLVIPDLEDLGEKIVHFYALGTNEVVLIDYNSEKQAIKQRLIEVFDDGCSVTVRSSYDYGLKIPYSYIHGIKPAVGKRFVVIMTRENFDGPLLAVKLSKRPKKYPDSEREERRQFDSYLHQLVDYIRDQEPNLRISSFVSPFFTENDRKLNFVCMDRETCELLATKIASVDITSGECSIRGATYDAVNSFPQDKYGQNPYIIDCDIVQNGFDHIALMTKYRIPRTSFRWTIAAYLFSLQLFFVRQFFLVSDVFVVEFLAEVFLWLASEVSKLRNRLVIKREARIGMLNTETWTWKDLSSSVEGCKYSDIHLELSPTSGNLIVIVNEVHLTFETGLNVHSVRRLGRLQHSAEGPRDPIALRLHESPRTRPVPDPEAAR
ncbi:hypothetical protein L596_028346 [Steinernema carpocapsae]|uniref:Uncharacterized protein n=1 Tax=Steinernema carpocapsae TaxID=34508 RepID=A0A4U5LY90_STECR|nr:hypothetical protein L596_028346 [Steinernema carpocapsae]